MSSLTQWWHHITLYIFVTHCLQSKRAYLCWETSNGEQITKHNGQFSSNWEKFCNFVIFSAFLLLCRLYFSLILSLIIRMKKWTTWTSFKCTTSPPKLCLKSLFMPLYHTQFYNYLYLGEFSLNARKNLHMVVHFNYWLNIYLFDFTNGTERVHLNIPKPWSLNSCL